MFMKVRKAYEALTDEDAKRNYELFGNRMGAKLSNSPSACHPSFEIRQPQHDPASLSARPRRHCALVVWKYWSWSRKFADNAVLTETLQIYLHPVVLSTETLTKQLPETLAMAAEYRNLKPTMQEAKELDKLQSVSETSSRSTGKEGMASSSTTFATSRATSRLHPHPRPPLPGKAVPRAVPSFGVHPLSRAQDHRLHAQGRQREGQGA